MYTKTGDKGKSSLYDGSRAEKDDRFFMALGDVDELNSSLGLCYEYCKAEGNGLDAELTEIQSRLFDVGTAVATPSKPEAAQERLDRAAFADDATTMLESRIDAMDESLPPLRNFILPSGGLASAHLHVARTVCRRAERRVTGLVRDGLVQPSVQRYLNRLSDYLFTAARFSAQHAKMPETVYKKAAAPSKAPPAEEEASPAAGGADGK